MIISKTPFRISLFGGSTDYESFYSQYGSLLIGFGVDKYCYVLVRETPKIFNHTTKAYYASTEVVNNNADIKHNGIRGVLQYLEIQDGLEISHLGDLPSQTGIGSSSSFIVGLLNCIHHLKSHNVNRHLLAQQAIHIERKLLGEAGGIQDQIWAAYGGMNSIHINTEGSFEVKPLPISEDLIKGFFDRSILIHTGRTRQSYKIAQSHNNKTAMSHKQKIAEIAHAGYEKFIEGDIDAIGTLLHDSWVEKQKISPLVSSKSVNELYKSLQQDGMIGGKLLGSGGQGFIFGILNKDVNISKLKFKYDNKYVACNLATEGSVIINN